MTLIYGTFLCNGKSEVSKVKAYRSVLYVDSFTHAGRSTVHENIVDMHKVIRLPEIEAYVCVAGNVSHIGVYKGLCVREIETV